MKSQGFGKGKVLCAAVLSLLVWHDSSQVNAQTDGAAIPDLSGLWDGGGRARPVNGVDVPWTAENFPVLNERAIAYQQVFEEIIAPKYDCQPASSPAVQYDPYNMQVTQWPDRVLFRYEKDDQLRTVWLDGREPKSIDFSNQGFSVGRYEDGALLVTTTHFLFDITGFDDYNGIPSSSQKVVTERYWMEGEDLHVTLTVEDPMFLREPASYTTRWIPAREGYVLSAFDCDAESARASVRFFPSKYK
ncbi:MAG: hypothetical protein Q7U82_10635 [Gammaproteobacteria bacterium]|nr:hypothetical protein [Gammaproteobacteria bacterium]